MQTEAILPLVQCESDACVRYFANDGCVDYTDREVAVYVGGSLIGTFTPEQPVERDLLIVVVCREPRVRVSRVAAAFGLDVKTIYRIRRKRDQGGVQAIAKSHRRGRPRRQTPQLEQELFALFASGASIDKAHERIGEQVSRSVLARVHQKWSELQPSSRGVEEDAPAAVAEDRAGTLPLPGIVDVPSPSGRPDEDDEDDAVVEATGELEIEQACRMGGRLAALDDDHPKRAIYQGDLEHARELQRELETLRPRVPTHPPVRDTELAGKLKRHPGHYKVVIDTLRVALANIETDLAAWLGPELPKPAEAKKTLAKVFDAPGHVRPNGRTITITLQPAGTDAELLAVDALLSRLNAMNLTLPGDPSGRSLRFKLGIK